MVIYQIYPRSFYDANNDGLGDLPGIATKLDYLKALGVDCLWISPFFKSPMKDFGYDVADYCAVDPIFGTMKDFDVLVEKCRKFGMDVMIDMVLSHTSDQHPWFIESQASKNNPKANWYVWSDGDTSGPAKEAPTKPPNNWIALFGGSAWQWNESRQAYYFHNFLTSQPDLNFHEPAVQEALLEACEFWLKKGVRGFRLDVCNFYFHSQGLENNALKEKSAQKTDGVHTENPYNLQTHVFDKDRPENLQFLASLRSLTDRYPGTVLMGEIVSDDSLKVMSQYTSGAKPLQTAYNFSLFREGFDGGELAKVLADFENRLPMGKPTWALGNHDVPRFLSRFKAEKGWPQSAKCFLFFLFSLRGNVILYQGDELGFEEIEIPRELMQDPFGIAFYPEFKGRDGCRTPIAWKPTDGEKPSWLPISKKHLAKSVELQESQPDSVLAFTKKLVSWRKANSWLETAPLKILSSSADTLVIGREIAAQDLFVAAFNGGPEKRGLDIENIGRVDLEPYAFKAWLREPSTGLYREFDPSEYFL
jgi:alpha-glucosidase